MSICLIGLPGQFSFASEALMAVSLMWPALLAVLVCPPAKILVLVAITSIAAVCAHPNAAAVLGFAAIVAILFAVLRPELRNLRIRLAVFLGVLLAVRILLPLDHYEKHLVGLATLLMSLHDSVLGWPLIGVSFTILAGLSCLWPSRSVPRAVPFSALMIASAAFIAWAIHPASWTKFDDYRFWEPAFSMILMAVAAVEVLRPQLAEPTANEVYGSLLPLIGGIFLTVFSIMSFVWARASNRLVGDLVNSDRGCISFKDVAAAKDTALDQWSLGFYAIELQAREPQTLLLKHNLSCRMFAHSGDAILAENPAKIYIKRRDEGWFDFDSAHKRARRSWIVKLPATE